MLLEVFVEVVKVIFEVCLLVCGYGYLEDIVWFEEERCWFGLENEIVFVGF